MSLKVTISGSFRKFSHELERAMTEFQDIGVEVLSPRGSRITSYLEGFVCLDKDMITDMRYLPECSVSEAMRIVEDSHLRAIKRSDFLWLILTNGYCGISAAFEIGWARAHRIPAYYGSQHISSLTEPIVRMYCKPVKSIADLIKSKQ